MKTSVCEFLLQYLFNTPLFQEKIIEMVAFFRSMEYVKGVIVPEKK